MRTDGYQTYHGDHFIMCLNIESLCCTPENNIICTSSIFQQNKTATTTKILKKPRARSVSPVRSKDKNYRGTLIANHTIKENGVKYLKC